MTWVDQALIGVGAAALAVELVIVAGRRWWGKRWPTISQVMRRRARSWLSIPFGWNVLNGHFFHLLWWEDLPWLGRVLPPHQPWMSWALAASLTGVFARDLWVRRHPVEVSKRVVFWVAVAGFPVGAVLWAQG